MTFVENKIFSDQNRFKFTLIAIAFFIVIGIIGNAKSALGVNETIYYNNSIDWDNGSYVNTFMQDKQYNASKLIGKNWRMDAIISIDLVTANDNTFSIGFTDDTVSYGIASSLDTNYDTNVTFVSLDINGSGTTNNSLTSLDGVYTLSLEYNYETNFLKAYLDNTIMVKEYLLEQDYVNDMNNIVAYSNSNQYDRILSLHLYTFDNDYKYASSDFAVLEFAPSNVATGSNNYIYTCSESVNSDAYNIFSFNVSEENISESTLMNITIPILSLGNPNISYNLSLSYCENYLEEFKYSWNNYTSYIGNCTAFFNVSMDDLLEEKIYNNFSVNDLAPLINSDSDKLFSILFKLLPEESSTQRCIYTTTEEYATTWAWEEDNNTLKLEWFNYPPPDIQAPYINVTYPINNTRIGNYSGNISFYVNESANCSINNSNWVNSYNDSINFDFNYALVPDGEYWINISCTDGSENEAHTILYFESDSTPPQIISYLPIDNDYSNLSSQEFKMDLFDNFALDRFNISVYNSTGYLEYSNFTENISLLNDTQTYNFSVILNTLSWTNTEDNFTYFIQAWDSVENTIIHPSYFYINRTIPPTPETPPVVINNSFNVDFILILVVAIYIFLILFAFKSSEWLILLFASIYGLFMGLWLWNTYPLFPKILILVILTFNAFLIAMAIFSKNK